MLVGDHHINVAASVLFLCIPLTRSFTGDRATWEVHADAGNAFARDTARFRFANFDDYLGHLRNPILSEVQFLGQVR